MEDRKSGRTTADIDDNSVRNLIDGICSGRLINDICYLKAGGLRYILVCPRAGFRSCRHGNGTINELLAQTLLQLFLQFPDNPACPAVIYNYTIPKHACRLLFTGHRLVIFIQYYKYNIGSSQIQTGLEAFSFVRKYLLLRTPPPCSYTH